MLVPVFAEVVFVTLLIICTACQSSVWAQNPKGLSLQQQKCTKEEQEQLESDNLKTCEAQQVGRHEDFRNAWVELEA